MKNVIDFKRASAKLAGIRPVKKAGDKPDHVLTEDGWHLVKVMDVIRVLIYYLEVERDPEKVEDTFGALMGVFENEQYCEVVEEIAENVEGMDKTKLAGWIYGVLSGTVK